MNSPFKFLDSYTKEDKDIFFGRDKEIEELYSKVFESKLILVYGASGTGKSSLINCGLANKFEDSDWLPVNVRRGNNINSSLAQNIQSLAITPVKSNGSLNKSIQSLYLDHFKPVYFIFDQFEELFIFGTTEERAEFITSIKDILEEEIQCRFIFVLRGEYLENIAEFENVIPDFFENRTRIEKMTRTGAIDCITGPCGVHNIEVEEGFAPKLLEKLSPDKAEIELTYLQVFLDKLYKEYVTRDSSRGKKKDASRFTLKMLTDLGRIGDVLSDFLEEQISILPDSETGLTILKAFVSLQGTKKQIGIEEIKEFSQTLGKDIPGETIESNIHQFVDLRILRDKDDNDKYELRHDSLAKVIYEKISNVEKNILEIWQFILNSFNEYKKRGVLLSEDNIKYIQLYETDLLLSTELKGFIQKSKKSVAKKRKSRMLIILFSFFISILLVLTGIAYYNSEHLKRKILKIAKSNSIATKAYMTLNEDPTLAYRLAEAAYRIEPTPLANQVLMSAYGHLPFYGKFSAHNAWVKVAKFSPDGKFIVSASGDNTAIVWNIDGTIKAKLIGHTDELCFDHPDGINFSPDSKLIVTTSLDGTARLWDVNGKCLHVFKGHQGLIVTAYIKVVERKIRILTACTDGNAALWDIDGNIFSYYLHNNPQGNYYGLSMALFTPENDIITLDDGGYANVFDISGNSKLIVKMHDRAILDAAVTEDSKYLFTAGNDNKIGRLDLANSQVLLFEGHSSFVNSIDIDTDRKMFVSASKDNTIRIWDFNGENVNVLEGHKAMVWNVDISPCKKYIVSSSDDGTAKLWNWDGVELMNLKGHRSQVLSAKFSSDSKFVITSSGDKTINVWNIEPDEYSILRGHQAYVVDAQFSPDGNNILTTGWDYTARIWSRHGKQLQTLKHNSHYVVNSATFLPNSKYIISNSRSDTIIYLWSIDGKLENTISTVGNVSQIQLLPDSKHLLVSSFYLDGVTNLINMEGEVLQEFKNIMNFKLSPSSKYLLTENVKSNSYDDYKVRLWSQVSSDVRYEEVLTLNIDSNDINSFDFSRDENLILASTSDSVVRIWNIKGNSLTQIKDSLISISNPRFANNNKYVVGIINGLNQIRIWEINGKLIATLTGHSDQINNFSISHDDQFIATCSNDFTTRLWNMQGKELQVYTNHNAAVYKVSFSNDDKYILTASDDHTVGLMPLFVNDIINKVNSDHVRGNVWQLSNSDKEVYGIIERQN